MQFVNQIFIKNRKLTDLKYNVQCLRFN